MLLEEFQRVDTLREEDEAVADPRRSSRWSCSRFSRQSGRAVSGIWKSVRVRSWREFREGFGATGCRSRFRDGYTLFESLDSFLDGGDAGDGKVGGIAKNHADPSLLGYLNTGSLSGFAQQCLVTCKDLMGESVRLEYGGTRTAELWLTLEVVLLLCSQAVSPRRNQGAKCSRGLHLQNRRGIWPSCQMPRPKNLLDFWGLRRSRGSWQRLVCKWSIAGGVFWRILFQDSESV